MGRGYMSTFYKNVYVDAESARVENTGLKAADAMLIMTRMENDISLCDFY